MKSTTTECVKNQNREGVLSGFTRVDFVFHANDMVENTEEKCKTSTTNGSVCLRHVHGGKNHPDFKILVVWQAAQNIWYHILSNSGSCSNSSSSSPSLGSLLTNMRATRGNFWIKHAWNIPLTGARLQFYTKSQHLFCFVFCLHQYSFGSQ